MEHEEAVRIGGERVTPKDEARFLSSLGLCVKARKVIFGVPLICEAMRKKGEGAPVLVIEAGDTSDNTHKKLSDKCVYYNIKHIRVSVTGERLSDAVGKSNTVAAVAITDKNISLTVEKNI